MNRVYKVIWSKAKHCYVVTSEIARSVTKSASSARSAGRKGAAVLAMAALLFTAGGVLGEAANVTDITVNDTGNVITVTKDVGDPTPITIDNVAHAKDADYAKEATKAYSDGDGLVIKNTYAKVDTDGKVAKAVAADSAEQATKDGKGNEISSTYVKIANAKVSTDGICVKVANTVGKNLSALDEQVKKNTMAVVEVGETAGKTFTDLYAKVQTNADAVAAEETARKQADQNNLKIDGDGVVSMVKDDSKPAVDKLVLNKDDKNQITLSKDGIKVGLNSGVMDKDGFYAGGDTADEAKAALKADGSIKGADGKFTVDKYGNADIGGDLTVDKNLTVNGTFDSKTLSSTVDAKDDYTTINGGNVTSEVNDKVGAVEYTAESIFNKDGSSITVRTDEGIVDSTGKSIVGAKEISQYLGDNAKPDGSQKNVTRKMIRNNDGTFSMEDKAVDEGKSSTVSQNAEERKVTVIDGNNKASTNLSNKGFNTYASDGKNKTYTKQTATDIKNTAEKGMISHTAKNLVNTASENMTNTADKDLTTTVGGNETRTVKGTLTETVTGNVTEDYKADLSTKVGGNETHAVTGNQTVTVSKDRTVNVKGTETENFNAQVTNVKTDQQTSVGGNQTNIVTGNQQNTVSGSKTETVKGAVTEKYSSQATTVDGDQSTNVGGNQTHVVTGNQTVTVSKDRTVNVKGTETENFNAQVTNVKTNQQTSVGGKQTNIVGGDQQNTVSGSKTETVNKAVTEKYGSQATTVNGDQSTNVGGNQSNVVKGNQTNTISGSKTESVKGAVSETYGSQNTKVNGDQSTTVTGKQTNSITGDQVNTIGGKQTTTVTGDSSLSAKNITNTASEKITNQIGNGSAVKSEMTANGITNTAKEGTIYNKSKDILNEASGDIINWADGEIGNVATKITNITGDNTVTSDTNGTTFENKAHNTAVKEGTVTKTTISGNTIETGQATMDYADVTKDLSVGGNATVENDLTVKGASEFVGRADFRYDVYVDNNLTVAKETRTDTLYVDHDGYVGGNLNVDGNIETHDAVLSADSRQVVTGRQLYQTNERVDRLDNRIKKVGANAAALAALRPGDFNPDDKFSIAAGFGSYRNANAAALGLFYRPNENVLLSLGTSFGDGENMVNAGVSVKFGRGKSMAERRKEMANEVSSMRDEMRSQDERIAELEEMLKKQSELIEKLSKES